MKKIKIKDLQTQISSLLLKAGLSEEYTKWVTDVYMRSTYRGVGHHDIYSLPGRIKSLVNKRVNNNPEMKRLAGFNALEVYDGDNGLGEVNSYYITKKSMELAQKYGIGLVCVKNSNHFLASAPYVDFAAEKGFLSIIYSSVALAMGIEDSGKIIGNGPTGYAVKGKESNILFDICLAYSSYGKFRAKIKNGEKVPEYWGKNKCGEFTDDPSEIVHGGVPLPIGQHKGFGLSVMIELLTTVLSSAGSLADKRNKSNGKFYHTIVTIKPDTVCDDYYENVDQLVNDLKNLYPEVHIPGDNSFKKKKEFQEKGYFELEDSLVEELKSLQNRLKLD